MPSKDQNIGFKRAREARERLGLSADGPLDCLLTAVEETAGIPVIVMGLPADVAGACCGAGTGDPLLLVNGAQHAVRQRFTLAHELGHVCCGHTGVLPKDTWRTLAATTGDPREVQANAFAAEFLMPRAGVLGLLGPEPSLDEVVVLAAGFGVSAMAGFVRVSQLGLLVEGQAAMRAQLDAQEHGEVWRRRGCVEIDDAFRRLRESSDALPHFSPVLRGGALAAVLAGEASVEAAAASAGADPASLAALVRQLVAA